MSAGRQSGRQTGSQLQADSQGRQVGTRGQADRQTGQVGRHASRQYRAGSACLSSCSLAHLVALAGRPQAGRQSRRRPAQAVATLRKAGRQAGNGQTGRQAGGHGKTGMQVTAGQAGRQPQADSKGQVRHEGHEG